MKLKTDSPPVKKGIQCFNMQTIHIGANPGQIALTSAIYITFAPIYIHTKN